MSTARPDLHVLEGGATNSRPTARTCTTLGGSDTVRLRYRGVADNADRLRDLGARELPLGELRADLDGVKFGLYPDTGLMYAEARTAAMLYGPDDHRLCTRRELVAAAERVTDLARDSGLVVHDDPRVGRLDVAADLFPADAERGRLLMLAATKVDLPWLKVGTEGGKRDRLETVYWRSARGRTVLMRLYCKATESGQGDPGTWLRLERQQRFRRSRERPVSDFAQGGFVHLFGDRYLESLMRVDAVVMGDRLGLVERLREIHRAGSLSGTRLQALSGFVVTGGEGLSERTVYKRWGELRELGLALDESMRGAVVVDLADYARQAISTVARAA